MKKLSAIVTLLLLVLFNIHCGLVPVSGSGVAVTTSYDYQNFTALSFGHGCEATIERADSFSVEVSIDDNLERYLRVSKRGDKLHIGLLSGNAYRSVTLRATIKTPYVNDVTGSGGSEISVAEDFAAGDDLQITLSGGSRLTGKFTYENISAVLSGGSRLEIQDGATDLLVLTASGGSRADLKELGAKEVTVLMSGGSRAWINASEMVSGKLSGGSDLEYCGGASQQISTSGGSSLRRVECGH